MRTENSFILQLIYVRISHGVYHCCSTRAKAWNGVEI